MRKLLIVVLLALGCGHAELTVYRVAPVNGGKVIEVISAIDHEVGDTVGVNLSDSEIDTFFVPKFIVESIYKSKKY